VKLINDPCECGYTDQEPNWRDTHCRHPRTDGTLLCDNPTKFPINCPLEDGKPLNFLVIKKDRPTGIIQPKRK